MHKWIQEHSPREVALAALFALPLWGPMLTLYLFAVAGLVARMYHWMLAGF